MTHDPLCPSSDKRYDYTNTETRATSFGRIGLTRPCQCHLIAKVRADERKQAEARVETLRNSPGIITISAAAALAAGDTWVSQW